MRYMISQTKESLKNYQVTIKDFAKTLSSVKLINIQKKIFQMPQLFTPLHLTKHNLLQTIQTLDMQKIFSYYVFFFLIYQSFYEKSSIFAKFVLHSPDESFSAKTKFSKIASFFARKTIHIVLRFFI